MDDKIMARMALAQVQVEKVNIDIKINKAIRSSQRLDAHIRSLSEDEEEARYERAINANPEPRYQVREIEFGKKKETRRAPTRKENATVARLARFLSGR